MALVEILVKGHEGGIVDGQADNCAVLVVVGILLMEAVGIEVVGTIVLTLKREVVGIALTVGSKVDIVVTAADGASVDWVLGN